MTASTAEQIVTALLSSAQLPLSESERAGYVNDYPLIRASADGLYLPELEFVEPASRFDPTTYYTAD